MPTLRLYDFPTSPFCIKVRAVLRHKQLAFETFNAIAPRHWWRLQREGVGKVPALDWDGEFVHDSARIAREIERRCPTPPALPADPRCHDEHDRLERWADEDLHAPALWSHWIDAEGWPAVRGRFPRGPLGAAAAHGYRARIAGQLRAQGTGRMAPAQIEAGLRSMLDVARERLGDAPWLFGEQPTVCDFAWYGQLLFLRRSPRGGRVLKDYPTLTAYWRQAHARYGDTLPPSAWR